MKKSSLFLLLVLFSTLNFLSPILTYAASTDDTVSGKNSSTTTGKKSTDRKKAEKRPKNPRVVRTSVLPRAANTAGTTSSVSKRVSLGTAMGLGKHNDLLNLKSNAAIVVDQQSQEVLFEKHADTVLPIASITKLMTAMTVLDSRLDLDEVLKINEEDVAIYKKSRLIKGTELTRREALLLALMSSENRAAYTLGRNYPGGMPAFMAALNRKAKEIGMIHSSFEDPTGLTSKNVSTPEDLVLMVNAASRYALIREYSTTASYSKLINNRLQEFISSNRLVRSGNMEITLQKTGYISEAGRCLVMQAVINNKPYIMVFLDSQGSQSRFADAVRVKSWLDDDDNVKPTRRMAFKNSSTLGVSSLNLPNNPNGTTTPVTHSSIESLLETTH